MLEQVMAELEALTAQPSTLDASGATQGPEPSTVLSQSLQRSPWRYGVVVLLAAVLTAAWLLTR
jgi:hypothetical protein